MATPTISLDRMRRSVAFRCALILAALAAISARVHAQDTSRRPREFRRGAVNRITDLPASKLRSQLERLNDSARAKALERLHDFHFTEADLDALDVDEEGGVLYVDHFEHEPVAVEEVEPVPSAAAVPISPLPPSLVFHSRPGAPNVLFLNFTGDSVTNTAWNTSMGRELIPAVAFSADGDYTTFSDAEQLAIKRIWQRVAEDYAPFDIDVTTERPATFSTRTAHALITRNTDANGAANPSSTAGGVAYIDSFATSAYARFRPAWVYCNNFSGNESLIAEAVSHEVGHNMGLSHDGKTDGATYYSGHGSGETSWGPIMGTGYNRNVSQWSRGEYYLANNSQDDLAIIAAKVSYRPDDHGNTALLATALVLAGTNIVSTTPENDVLNENIFNKGTIERETDVDVFSFSTGAGVARLNVVPWVSPSGTRAGNLDVLIELTDAAGNLLATNNSPTATGASIQTTVAAGTYFLHVRSSGAGTPLSPWPSGYTSYASLGQYFISGNVAPFSLSEPPIAPRLAITRSGGASVLNWSTTAGNFYTLWSSTNATGGFTRIPGASNLPSTTTRWTNAAAAARTFYRLEALKP